MTKEALIDQATKAWFVIAATNFAGYTEMDRLARQDYNNACTKLSYNYGIEAEQLGEMIVQSRVASFYTDFARQVLGGHAAGVAA